MNEKLAQSDMPSEQTRISQMLMSELPTGSVSKSAPIDLEIMVDVHVASIGVPVSDVRNWLSGAVVSLPSLTDQNGLTVELRNGNRVIATGSLVRLDDAYGVLIEHIPGRS